MQVGGHDALQAFVTLPSESSAKKRPICARLYALFTRTAEEASAALAFGEQLVSALSAHMAARKTTHYLVRSAREVSGAKAR